MVHTKDNVFDYRNYSNSPAPVLSNPYMESSLSTLFDDTFIRNCSNFTSLSNLLANTKYANCTEEELEALPPEEFDTEVRKFTSFDSFDEMLNAAIEAFLSKHKVI